MAIRCVRARSSAGLASRGPPAIIHAATLGSNMLLTPFILIAATLPNISILVNIDSLRYDARMARQRTTLVNPDVRLLQALADPTRLAIVRELAGTSEICACDLTTCCDVRQPTVSHHLRVLKEAGVVESERKGTWIYYRLVPAAADRLRGLAGEMSGSPQLIHVSGLSRRSPTPSSAARPS